MNDELKVAPTLQDGIVRRQRWIIIGLSVLVVGSVAAWSMLVPAKINLAELSNHKFGPVDSAYAHPNIRAYRKDGAYASLSYYKRAKVFGILHETPELTYYLDTIVPNFINTHTTVDTSYEWKIAIYPMICKVNFEGDERPRIGFYLIPTMVKKGVQNPTKNEIIDYMEAMGKPEWYNCYYPPQVNGAARIGLTDKFIFDEGHLWP